MAGLIWWILFSLLFFGCSLCLSPNIKTGMKTFLTFIGTILTLLLILYRNSPSDLSDLFLRVLIILGIPILAGIALSVEITRKVTPLAHFILTPVNRYSFTGLLTFLLIFPIGHTYLLNDFVFILMLIVICWSWMSWCFYLEKQW